MPIIAIAMGGILFSCVDSGKDLYDPSYETSNPMGDGFAAPDGFDWSTIKTENVTVEVKDEEGGLYSYLVEIYTEYPLTNENASVLATRTANKENNFKATAAITLLPTQKGIYIKQTDPRGRVEVHLFDVPEDNDNFACKLYDQESAAQNRVLMSRTATTRAVSPEKPVYTSIPSEAKEITEMQGTTLLRDASYKITSDYNGTFKFDGYDGEIKTKVYVDATWTIPTTFQFQNGIEIIVMDNAKIKASGVMTFIRNSMLTVMDEGNVEAENISFTNGAPAALRNWGNVSVTNTMTLHSGATLYNGGTITSKDIAINSNTQIINDNKIELEGEFNLPSNFSLENNGEIYGKKMIANSDAVITNKNIIIFETISFTNPTVNNSCSMEATISFYANGIKLNLTQGYIKAPKMEFQNGVVNLNNGSMLEATTRLDIPPGYATFYGKGENTSMIKSPIIAGQGFTYDGNLAIESDNHVEKSPHWTNFHVQNGAYITKIGESKVTIEVCTGTKNEGNKGEDGVLKEHFKGINRGRLLSFCRRNGISENVVFLTAFNYCIGLFSNEKDTVGTSIHSGRTDSRWNRLAGPLFLTYYFRCTQKPDESVKELLQTSGKQIMKTMGCYISNLHADEMFFQYQGDILNIDQIGGWPVEREKIQLDALPFHLQVMWDEKGYYYELRYWKNRFDTQLLKLYSIGSSA